MREEEQQLEQHSPISAVCWHVLSSLARREASWQNIVPDTPKDLSNLMAEAKKEMEIDGWLISF